MEREWSHHDPKRAAYPGDLAGQHTRRIRRHAASEQHRHLQLDAGQRQTRRGKLFQPGGVFDTAAIYVRKYAAPATRQSWSRLAELGYSLLKKHPDSGIEKTRVPSVFQCVEQRELPSVRRTTTPPR